MERHRTGPSLPPSQLAHTFSVVARDPTSGEIYMAAGEEFSLPGVSGDESDVFVCAPGSLGASTSCTFRPFWDGSANGFGDERVDGLSIGSSAHIEVPAPGPVADLSIAKRDDRDPDKDEVVSYISIKLWSSF